MATSLILGAAGLAVTVLDIASFLQSLGGTPDPQKQTQVTLVVGSAPNSEGSIPDIYAKGPFGFQLAHSSDKSLFRDGHLEGSQAKTFIIDNDPGIDFQTQTNQPQYVSVVMTQGDAICLSAVIANGNDATYTWTGDMGAQCGAEWYESDFAFGNSNVPPKCVWLDSDHSNDIVASAVSMHMTDFAGPLLGQYQEKNEAGDDIGDARLCKNSARMTFYHDFKYENWATFDQPLKFNGSGAFEEPDLGIDREKRAYPDGTDLPWERPVKARGNYPRSLPQKRNMNHQPDHLTISHLPSHSARRLCESATSRGADFLAIHGKEKLFCDMSRKQLFDVCDEAHTQACFDMDKQEMRDVGAKIRRRDVSFGNVVPKKSYKTHSEWK